MTCPSQFRVATWKNVETSFEVRWSEVQFKFGDIYCEGLRLGYSYNVPHSWYGANTNVCKMLHPKACLVLICMRSIFLEMFTKFYIFMVWGICLGPSIVNPTSFCYWLNNDVQPCFSDFIYLFIYFVFGATLLFPL